MVLQVRYEPDINTGQRSLSNQSAMDVFLFDVLVIRYLLFVKTRRLLTNNLSQIISSINQLMNP